MAEQFDVIVVGAGSAGVCSAAELTLQGAKTLLVAESKEVGYQFRPVFLGGGAARAIVQSPSRNLWGEGGYWLNLARKLNIPLRYVVTCFGISVTIEGSGEITDFPNCPTAASITDLYASLSPVPLGASRDCLERVLHAGLMIPPTELASMQQVPLVEWLEKEGADELTTALCLVIGANYTYLNTQQAAEHMSVFGLFGPMRSYLGGDAQLCTIEPDCREGLWIPMARAIEERGSTVWRGSRVAEITVRNGVASGVILQDGREATAPVIASTLGSGRMKSVLDPLPPEAERVIAFEEATIGDLKEYTTFALTERVVDSHPGMLIATVRADGSFVQVDWNLTSLGKWCSPPGTNLIASEVVRSEAEVEAMGGESALHAEMQKIAETTYPGYLDSMTDFAALRHPQLVTAFLTGPKLPRQSPSVDGLWYVGENSQPVDGCYTDGASSAGVLGARAIARTVKS